MLDDSDDEQEEEIPTPRLILPNLRKEEKESVSLIVLSIISDSTGLRIAFTFLFYFSKNLFSFNSISAKLILFSHLL